MTTIVVLHYGRSYIVKRYNQHLLNPRTTLPPYLHHTIDDPPSTIFRAGDVMYLHTEVDRQVQCTVDLNYRIISEHVVDGTVRRVVFHTYPQTRTVVSPGMYYSDVRLVIPDWMLPGDYVLDRNATYLCQGMKIENAKPLPMQIIE